MDFILNIHLQKKSVDSSFILTLILLIMHVHVEILKKLILIHMTADFLYYINFLWCYLLAVWAFYLA